MWARSPLEHIGGISVQRNCERIWKLRASPIKPLTFDAREIADLPQPVQRYFRAVLKEGQPLIAAARVSHEGTFNMSETAEKWSAFTSTQLVITQRPGFDWDGRIAMIPGINAFVHDAYISGEGILHAALLGLVTLADMRGTPEAAPEQFLQTKLQTDQ